MQPMLRFEAAVMLAFAFDAHESDAMHVAETLPGIDIAYEVRKMTMAGFDRGVTKDGVIEGITAHSDKFGTFAIDRAVMGATDLRAPMIRLVNGEALSPALLDGIGLGRIDYDGITIQPPDKQTLHVGRVSLGPVAFAKGMPVSGALGWQDISIPRSMVTNATARDVFDKLGLETMTTSFTVSYDWDVAGQRASLHDTALKVNELGTLTLAADLGSVVANADALTQARLVHARLRLDDASLVDRMLRAGAAMAGTDLTAYRQQVMDQLRQRGATMGGDSPLIAAAGQAVADFVASPHSLTIELSPPAPVPLFALKGAIAVPAELAAVLGLSVSANQP
jgi:hypothetical protein